MPSCHSRVGSRPALRDGQPTLPTPRASRAPSPAAHHRGRVWEPSEGSHTRENNPGGDLLSHRVSPAVPSALEGLTSEVEMGSGVAPPELPPETFWCLELRARLLNPSRARSPSFDLDSRKRLSALSLPAWDPRGEPAGFAGAHHRGRVWETLSGCPSTTETRK